LAHLVKHAPKSPFDGPVFLELVALMPRPKSHYGTGKNADVLKPSAPEWHTSKPDADNILKMLKDCMNELFFVDDKQVCVSRVAKKYTDGSPRWDVCIYQIETGG